MKLTITSRKNGIFDCCPICDVIIDDNCVGKLLPGKTMSYEMNDSHSHRVYCCYPYGKNNIEKTNIFLIDNSKNYQLILGTVYSTTYMGRFKENINTFFNKGYINVPDIELYEIE